VIAPTGTIGLLMDATPRSGTRLRPSSSSRNSREAIQVINGLRARSVAALGYKPGEIDDIVLYPSVMAHSKDRTHSATGVRSKDLPTSRSTMSNARWHRLRHSLRVNKWTLGEQFWLREGAGASTQPPWMAPNRSVAGARFAKAEIEAANLFVCGP